MWVVQLVSVVGGLGDAGGVTSALAAVEVARRTMWSFFRVENEQAANQASMTAYASIALPGARGARRTSGWRRASAGRVRCVHCAARGRARLRVQLDAVLERLYARDLRQSGHHGTAAGAQPLRKCGTRAPPESAGTRAPQPGALTRAASLCAAPALGASRPWSRSLTGPLSLDRSVSALTAVNGSA